MNVFIVCYYYSFVGVDLDETSNQSGLKQVRQGLLGDLAIIEYECDDARLSVLICYGG